MKTISKSHPNKSSNLINNQKGFSLTEVLIALVIFSIIALSLFYTLSFSLNQSHNSEEYQYAVNFAEEKMIIIKNNLKEYAKKIKYDTVPSLKEKISTEDVSWKYSHTKMFTYKRTIEIKIENISPLLVHTWITIKWLENEKEKQYVLESYL